MAPSRRSTRVLKQPRSSQAIHPHRVFKQPRSSHRHRRSRTGTPHGFRRRHRRSRTGTPHGFRQRRRGLRAILWGQPGHVVPQGANVDVDAALILAENALLFGYEEDLGLNLAPVLPMGPQLQDGEFEELQDLFGIGAGHNMAPVLLPIGPQFLEGELEELEAIFGIGAGLEHLFGIGTGLQDLFGIGAGHNLGLLEKLQDLFGIGAGHNLGLLEELQDLFGIGAGHNLVPVPPLDPQLLNGELGELPDLFGIGAGYEDAVYGFELDEAFDLDDLVASLEDYNPFLVLLDIEKASELDADPQPKARMLRDQKHEMQTHPVPPPWIEPPPAPTATAPPPTPAAPAKPTGHDVRVDAVD